MQAKSVWAGAVMLSLALPAGASDSKTLTTLRQITQEMSDAWAPGKSAVWARYADPSLRYVTEDNVVKTKSQLLRDMKPLPAGYSGRISVEEFLAQEFGSFAVSTYIQDEHETIAGQELHARYRVTDTWRRTAAGWRLVAAENLAVPTDPPSRPALPDQLLDYVGTYRLGELKVERLCRQGDHMVIRREGRPDQSLEKESGDVFFMPGSPRIRRIFDRSATGTVMGFADRREGVDLQWTRATDTPAPSDCPGG